MPTQLSLPISPARIHTHTFHGSASYGLAKLLPGGPGGERGTGTLNEIYTTDDPLIAQSYGNFVYAVDVDLKNPLILDAHGEFWPVDSVDRLVANARRDGYDGVIINNLREGLGSGYGDTVYDRPNTNVIVFNPDDLTIRGDVAIEPSASFLDRVGEKIFNDPWTGEPAEGADLDARSLLRGQYDVGPIKREDFEISEIPREPPPPEELVKPVEMVASQTGGGMVSTAENAVQAAGRAATKAEKPETVFIWNTVNDGDVCEDEFENSCWPRDGEGLLLDEWAIFGEPQAENLICTMYAKGGFSNCRCWLDTEGRDSEDVGALDASEAIAAGKADAEDDYGEAA